MEISENVAYVQNSTSMIVNIIQTTFLVIFSYYTNYRVCNRKISIDKTFLLKSILIIIITIMYIAIKSEVNYFIGITSLICMLALIFSIESIGHSIITTILSMSINYVVLLSSIIISFIINKIFKINNDYINVIVITILQIAMLSYIFRIKKFRHGILISQNNEYKDILILNISVIILFSIIITANSNISSVKNLCIGIMTFAVIMFITIQKSIQLYYKQKLLVQELNETKDKLEKKTKEVEELEAENLSFSKKSHTLAHKQKSLEFKLQELLTKAEISKEEAGEVRDRIKEIEKDLYKEKTVIELDKTGITEIDDMLKYMQSECKKNKIDFELQLKGNIHYMINNLIDKKDLETLLADHIKNAIIAINHTENVNKSILVRLGKIDETYGLYIYDSGIEFKPETLENLGKKPSTTHADEGGTGMGFMNTFDTLRKCNASMLIEEYNEPSKDNYTKSIMIKFDGKNEFKIKSYRENHLSYPQKVI